MYDRLTLLNIQSVVSGFLSRDPGEVGQLHPHYVPAALRKMCYLPGCVICRGAVRSEENVLPARMSVPVEEMPKEAYWTPFLVRSKKFGKSPFIGPASSAAETVDVMPNLRCSYLVPVFPSSSVPVLWSSWMVNVKRRSGDRRVNRQNLRFLCYGSPVNNTTLHTTAPFPDSISVTMALINARSLANKSFILNDLFLFHELDFLFVTETWLNVGETTPLSELSPPGCSFFSTPRSFGRGGGLTVVFKDRFKCRLLPSESHCTFETQLIMLNSFKSVMCFDL